MGKIKFSLLSVGASFSFRGENYTKTTPLLATNANGNQRMVPRSALVITEGDETKTSDALPSQHFDKQTVQAAFESFYTTCLGHLQDAGLDDSHPAIQQIALEKIRFLQVLDI